jgi:hypothetical protein
METVKYNCIAWAAGVDTEWWWPLKQAGYEWPGMRHEIPGQETIENFISAFESRGFTCCGNGKYENGFEKVALYVDGNQHPTHAARLLPTGVWTSKLGDDEDIEHKTLKCLEGKQYGRVCVYMRRPNALCRRPSILTRLLRRIFKPA